ncbi:hypothetical protein SEVIR_3G201250v4 [Setaria viridis]
MRDGRAVGVPCCVDDSDADGNAPAPGYGFSSRTFRPSLSVKIAGHTEETRVLALESDTPLQPPPATCGRLVSATASLHQELAPLAANFIRRRLRRNWVPVPD